MDLIDDIENPASLAGHEINGLVAALRAEVDRLRVERDRLIEGCVTECWRNNRMEHGWEWRYGNAIDFVETKAEAVAAVRRAAGLDPR